MTHTQARPIVSIGLPVYNGARFLARALDALLAQDFAAFEILISDNASTDGTPEIAAAYAAWDPRIRVTRSTMNTGVDANFARVLAASSGAYFMWAACDDWWAPGFVSTLLTALEANPAAVVAMSAVERVDESGQVVDVVRYADDTDPSRLTPWQLTMRLAGGGPYHLFVYGVYRTAFIKRAFTGFAPVVAADRLLLCRVAMGGNFAYVDDVLHRRTVQQASLAERYADEAMGRRWRSFWARWRLALAAGPYLWHSPVLPSRRRAWIPIIVLRLMKASVGHALVEAGWLGRRSSSTPHVC